jgi:hypothetical protein
VGLFGSSSSSSRSSKRNKEGITKMTKEEAAHYAVVEKAKLKYEKRAKQKALEFDVEMLDRAEEAAALMVRQEESMGK